MRGLPLDRAARLVVPFAVVAWLAVGWQAQARAAVVVEAPSALTGASPENPPAVTEMPSGSELDVPTEPALPLPPDERDGGALPDSPADEDAEPAEPGTTPPTVRPQVSDAALPQVHYGDADLPEPVRKTRAAILAAAKTGDISGLAPLLGDGATPMLSQSAPVGDPMTYLKEISGDPEGREVLAILADLLESGWVVVDQGTSQETYVWPYFAEIPVDRLTPPQIVELYRILTAADVDEMRAYGTWLFFRLTIAADGTWKTFLVPE